MAKLSVFAVIMALVVRMLLLAQAVFVEGSLLRGKSASMMEATTATTTGTIGKMKMVKEPKKTMSIKSSSSLAATTSLLSTTRQSFVGFHRTAGPQQQPQQQTLTAGTILSTKVSFPNNKTNKKNGHVDDMSRVQPKPIDDMSRVQPKTASNVKYGSTVGGVNDARGGHQMKINRIMKTMFIGGRKRGGGMTDDRTSNYPNKANNNKSNASGGCRSRI
ncbi:hypothetical protein ACA910_012357 [Epithemia clementina (nom. ined.)]